MSPFLLARSQLGLLALTVALATAAFTLTAVATFQCNFVTYIGIGRTAGEFGIWEHALSGSCQGYPDSMEIDASWLVARVFNVLSLSFGAILVLFYFIEALALYAGKQLNARGLDILACFLTGVFTGLILLLLTSNICKENLLMTGGDDSCKFSVGAKLTISASAIWFLATFFSMQLDIERERNRVTPLTADFPGATHPLIGGSK